MQPTSFPRLLLPAFSLRMLDQNENYLRAFPQPDGRTIVGERVDDWHSIPDGTWVAVEAHLGPEREGLLQRAHLLSNAELRLQQTDGTTVSILTEFVRYCYVAKAQITSEVFTTSAVA